MLPPAADGGYREFARVRIDPDVDVSLIVPDVIDAVWRRFAELLIRKVVHVDLYWLSFGKPQPPVILVVANELFLLGINRDIEPFDDLRTQASTDNTDLLSKSRVDVHMSRHGSITGSPASRNSAALSL